MRGIVWMLDWANAIKLKCIFASTNSVNERTGRTCDGGIFSVEICAVKKRKAVLSGNKCL